MMRPYGNHRVRKHALLATLSPEAFGLYGCSIDICRDRLMEVSDASCAVGVTRFAEHAVARTSLYEEVR